MDLNTIRSALEAREFFLVYQPSLSSRGDLLRGRFMLIAEQWCSFTSTTRASRARSSRRNKTEAPRREALVSLKDGGGRDSRARYRRVAPR